MGKGCVALLRELLADRDNRHSGRTEVLLRTGVEHGEPAVVARAGKNVGRHVADERRTRFGDFLHLRAGDRLVRADVAVGRAGRPLVLGCVGLAGGDILLAVGGDVHLADLLGLLDGLAAPSAALDIVGNLILAEEVHRDHRELHGRTALDEAHGPVVVKATKLLERGDRLLMDGIVFLAAMGHLHHGHSTALVVNQLLLGFLKDFEREHCGTCRKVIDARHFLNLL